MIEGLFALGFLLKSGADGLGGEILTILGILGVCLLFWAHIFEEHIREFGATLWHLLRGSLPAKPVPTWWQAKSLYVDKLGLGTILTALYILDGPCRVVVLGVIATDLVQHVLLAIYSRSFFAGFWTAVVLYPPILWFHGPEQLWSVAAAIGAAGIVLNFLTAAVGARKN